MRSIGGRERRADAKIDELRLPSLIDQNIGGLDVSVHHQHLMCRSDRIGEHHQERDPLAQRQVMGVAVPVDRLTLDVLHRDPCAALLRAGIDESRHRRMLETRQHLRLALEAQVRRTAHVACHHLEGHRLRYPVGALGPVHHPHAAFTDPLDEAKSPEFPTHQRLESAARRVGQRGR